MYVEPNFRTAKALREAIAQGKPVRVFSPGPFPAKREGTEFVEGPHYPEPHRWYAQVEVREGLVVGVKK